MLIELFEYITTNCPEAYKKMGYLKESIGTKSRYRRCINDWQPHLSKTKSTILETAKQIDNKERVVILGAGHLYDIPLYELTKLFKQVVLIDVVFLRSTLAQAKKFGAKCIITDVTGIIEQIYSTNNIPKNIPQPPPFLSNDFVISANIASQLPLLLRVYLSQNAMLAEEELSIFSKKIIEAHFAFLKTAEKALLITDTEFLSYIDEDEIIAEDDALYGVKLPQAFDEWFWEIAKAPEYHPEFSIKHRVKAYIIE